MARVAARSTAHWPRARTEPSEYDAPLTAPDLDRNVDWNSVAAIADDLSREVYCILGMPIDAIEMPAVMRCIEMAAANAVPFVISTPNINFLVNSQKDPEFRESLLLSDLCPADGMPIVWIARLMGIPIKHRIAGSDIFEALKVRARPQGPLKVFLFGAKESVVEAAARTLNLTTGLSCVGWICPGWGGVDELSRKDFIDKINSSNADFLVATLGAIKGQLWLHRNHRRLRIPLRSHLGATIHFQAGTVKRAPHIFQKLGLEWLWRIKEEPYLWRRYFYDGSVLLHLLLTRVLPLAISARWLHRRYKRHGHDLAIKQAHGRGYSVTLSLSGFATACHVDKVSTCLQGCGDYEKADRSRFLRDLRRRRTFSRTFAHVAEATQGPERSPALDGHLSPTGENVSPQSDSDTCSPLMLRKELKAGNTVTRFMGISCRLGRVSRGPNHRLRKNGPNSNREVRKSDWPYDDGSGQSHVGRRLLRQKPSHSQTAEKQQMKNH